MDPDMAHDSNVGPDDTMAPGGSRDYSDLCGLNRDSTLGQ